MIEILRVNDILSSERVLLNAPVQGIQQAFDAIGRLVCGAREAQAAEITRRLWGRERHGSTALGYGEAIPHAQITGLRRPVAAFLRSSEPLPFQAPDGRPVFDVLAILVPKPAAPRHFALLADARHLMCERDFRQALAGCADAPSVWQLFEQWPFYRGLQGSGQMTARTGAARMQQSNASP
ncbi:MAG: PTS sugar transporter subunit IIA [Polaromonas sp.]|nr:PTS sugar transporter subunit IIA [Polaromonas sp.]MDP3752807.1 PTS sugar transporter subunit IIA [Polaromonas sp.]